MTTKREEEQFEKIRTIIFGNAQEASLKCAREIADLIRSRAKEGRNAVLGLATGSTPVGVYRELIRMHREEGLSFRNVITFNLDEYYPIDRQHRESYYRFMNEQLFSHIDIPEEQVHIPSGAVPRNEVFEHCQQYEAAIRDAGGIDFQILGIGRTGHIGFNEPGAGEASETRLVNLDPVTRQDAARDFLGEANVPRFAITMGIGSILRAKRVVLMAWGEGKAEVVAGAVEGPITPHLPASFLQKHDDVTFYIDQAAASELTRIKHPWLTGVVEWTPRLTRKAVVWLSSKLNKPILKLVEADYSANGLAQLITHAGSAYHLNIRLFNEIQHTISGWPAGKPNADDSTRPERAKPFPKRVAVFAPEPMDDVAFLGGTIHRLVDQGNDVRVFYQTSGNLAVPDEEVLMSTGVVLDAAALSGNEVDGVVSFAASVAQAIHNKGQFEDDSQEIRRFKSVLRRGEARAATRIIGLTPDRIEFLDQQFYEKGRYRQFRIHDSDVEQLCEKLNELKPHQIYATGSQADPNSVAGASFQVLVRALDRLKDEPWLSECYVWLYRGEGQEWGLEEIDMTIPLSPDELNRKIKAVYQHLSQRSQTPVRPESYREFWQLIESINRATAEKYDSLGLAEYEAMEAFKRWK